ncbi:Gfo/Idh/MocA family oxidoreductase [Microbacterium sp. zg-Y818]|uniref:Gfo/Idh/MocA family protein n=1 Tax=unclassified Microbacterium TaxID=2609290 RepID=UPI00214D0A77|nr:MULTISPECIES: Gfo/Idh/MocA family oxidoreductase [unclassified Microbacterium]MCR2802030.1 Gfo/Idh/MocA family oxidoreductase [Microbacterium sp. zg.Y818]WIM22582.1 Gfo/Idh/MocA family oxidoreductase [Microbacterium sp. zg-Y818]
MDLNIGIVGFGARSTLWKEAHKPGRGSRVTAVCDLAERSRAEAREALPEALVTASLDELLASGIDAVMVLTPDHQHASVAIAALEAGVPVFCEKPLAVTLDDADAILETARRTGTRLYVGHNMRHMSVVLLMRRLILEGRIGEVKAVWCRHFVGNGGDYYFKDWHAEREKTTGLLLQKGAHDLDVIHWLAGAYTTEVQAMGALSVYGDIDDRRDRSGERMRDWFSLDNWPPTAQTGLNPVVDVEDISMVNMRLSNGVLASYLQCHFTPDYWRNYTVIGTAGRIENLGDVSGSEVRLWNRRHHGAAPADETFIVPAAPEDTGHDGADALLIAEFLRFVRVGGLTETSPVAAREAVAVGILATACLRGDGETCSVPTLDPDLVSYFEAGQVEQATATA